MEPKHQMYSIRKKLIQICLKMIVKDSLEVFNLNGDIGIINTPF